MPGLTTPLSEEHIRSLYGDDEEDDTDNSVSLAVDLISLILPQ